MPIKATVKLLRRTFLLCAALSFSAPLCAENAPDFHRWNTLVESGSTLLFYKTEAQLKNVTTNNTSGGVLHGKSALVREPASSPLTYTYVATPDLGYHFAHWSCTPIQITEVESSIYPFCYGENPELVFYVNKGSDSRTFKINLCPLFEPNAYTIKFDKNGASGGSMANLAMTYDTAKNLTANGFTKTGYSFKSWLNKSTNKSYANKASVKNLTSVNGATVTLTAQWTNNVYTVSFDTRGGSDVSKISVQFDKAYKDTIGTAFPGSPTKTGYNFMGWSLESDASSGNITGDSTVKTAANHILYATWQAIPYTITLDRDGGSGGSETISTGFDELMPNITSPSRLGYSFDGYYKFKNGSGTKYYNADGTGAHVWDVNSYNFVDTLYAHWIPNTYTIVFDKNDSDATGTMSAQVMTYDKSAALTPNAYTKSGYDFAGWTSDMGEYSDKQTVLNLLSENGAMITLKAKWSPKGYTVKFDGNGFSSGTMYPQSVAYEAVAKLKTNTFSRTGYTFGGWATTAAGDAEFGNEEEIKNLASPGGEVTLFAVWTPIKYKLAFNSYGGEGKMDEIELTYDQETKLPANTFTREHYDFSGWKLGSKDYADGASVINLTTSETTLTFYAQWTAKTCTVTFDPGEGTIASENATKTVQYNTKYDVLPTPDERHGYNFIGWHLESTNYSGQIYPTTYVGLSTDHTVTAIWMAKAEFLVSFNVNGGEALEPRKYIGDYTYGDRGLPTPVKTGYTFVKWHYAGSEDAVTDSTPMLKKDHMLYAAWQANQYSVTFVADGETYETINETYDSTYALPATDPEKAGYTFLGWYTAATEGVEVTAETKVAITAAQTLYARFGAKEYKIVFDKNHPNAVAAPTPVTVKYDKEYTLPYFAAEGEAHPNPSYRFVGWKHDLEDASDPLSAGTEVSKLSTGDDYIFYAIWELALNDLSAAAHCKNAEVSSEDWEIVTGDPTSIRSKISAIGGNADDKALTLAIRGSGTLYFLAKQSSNMSENLSLHLRGEDNGVNIDETIATTANWQLKSYSLTNVTKDFWFAIDYKISSAPPEHHYYLDEIVWLPDGESYEESREKFEVTVTATNFESWTSIPAADANGVITVYDGDSVKVWGTPLEGYTTSYKSEETAYVLTSVKQNETIVLTATQDFQLSDLAKAANCKNIDIVCSNGVGSDFGWEKVKVENDVGIWSLSPYTYDGITLTANTKGKGTLSFDYKTSSDTMNSGLEFAYRVIPAGVSSASVAWITLLDGGTKITTYTTKELSLDGDAKIEWRVTTSRGITLSDTKNRYYLNNIKWLAEGEEDTPDGPTEKTELEQWAELLGCAATESAVAEAKEEFAKNCKLTISFDATGKPVIGVTGVNEELAAKVRIECCEDLSNPIWTEHDPAQHTDCRFYRGTLDVGTSL